MLNQSYPMGHHQGGHGMTNSQKRPGGFEPHTGSLKERHLARADMIHDAQKHKMSSHGVLVEASPENIHMNLEAAYKAHHEGQEFGNVLAAMSTPHELKMLHAARREESTAQDVHMPKEHMNELI